MKHARVECNGYAHYNRSLYDGIVKAKLCELEKIAAAPLFLLIIGLTRVVRIYLDKTRENCYMTHYCRLH